MSFILGIDPGEKVSGYALWDRDAEQVGGHGEMENLQLRNVLSQTMGIVAMEHIRSYGQQVGNETLDTCEWIGRFEEVAAKAQVVKVPRPKILKEFGIANKGSDKWLKEWLYEHYPRVFKQATKNKIGALNLKGWGSHDLAALAVAIYVADKIAGEVKV